MLHLYGRPVSDQDARHLVATLMDDARPDAIAAASQIGYAVELDRVMVRLTPAMRDAVLAVLDDPPAGLLDLRGALARDRAHRGANLGSGTADARLEQFRVILIDPDRRRSNIVVDLNDTPQIGEPLHLPQGGRVTVHYVRTSARRDLAGVIIAGRA